ncbi:hypothetical protein BC830DRAFT_512353 [Chytriomyces sp. MP71]|nr:hypothetical protein BC830DRAFT_512353 [Chytriomyces sp. MP71]
MIQVNCLNILKHDHLIVQRKTFSGWVAQLQNFWVDFRKPKQVLRPSAISQRHDYYQNHEVSSSLNNVESHYSNSHHVLLQQKYNGPLLESANSKYFHSKTSILRPPTLARSAAVAADGFVNDISRNPSLLQTYGLQASSMDSNSNKNLATTRSYSQQLALMQNQGVPSSSNFKPHSGADRSKVDMNLYESLEDDGIDTVSDATITAISTPYREFEQRNFYDPSHLAVPMTSSVAPNSVLRHPQSCPGCFECFRVDASQHMLYQQQQQIQSHQQQVLQQHNIGGGGFSHTATHLWPAQ